MRTVYDDLMTTHTTTTTTRPQVRDIIQRGTGRHGARVMVEAIDDDGTIHGHELDVHPWTITRTEFASWWTVAWTDPANARTGSHR